MKNYGKHGMEDIDPVRKIQLPDRWHQHLMLFSRQMRQSLGNVINFRLCVDARETY
jgi:hypothetical protein